MGSKQQIGILKRDGLGKQHFDVENILTRSLYRVLNNTTQVPSQVAAKSQNVDKMNFQDRKTAIAVARPNNHQIGNASSVDMDMQMRLLAQEICSRVERKYERKLDDTRERDRRDTERRLISLRSEYEAKYQLQLGKLDKEKNRLMDQIAERERTLEHRMEMRSAEREHDLASKQRIVENRAIELTLNKENFEKMREEWQRKMEGELEEMRLERERIEVATSKTTDRRRSEMAVEAEVNMWKKRTEELEHDANLTRKRIGEMMEENFHLKDQIVSIDQVKRELEVAMTALNDSRAELATSKVEIRRTGDYDQLKDENEQLKIEIERLRLKSNQRIQSAVEETISEYSAKEAKWKRIAGLSQQRISVLTEKIKDLEIERDMLRQEVKNRQSTIGRSQHHVHSNVQKKTYSKTMFRSISPSESTSSLSEGEMEILNIRQRIQNLDEIAKELDASVEQFSTAGATRKVFNRNDSNVELYDDFCRALHSSVIDDEGSPLHMTSSPQKPTRIRPIRMETAIDSEKDLEDKRSEFVNDSWLRSGIRVVSPPAMKRPSGETRPAQVKQEDNAVWKEKTHVRPEEPELSELEQRLQTRGAAKDQRISKNTVSEPSAIPEPEPVQPSHETSETIVQPTSADNPMFSGVDPIMAEYMKKVLAARNANKTIETQQSTVQPVHVPVEAPRSREVEVTLADELELDLDQPNNANDDWW